MNILIVDDHPLVCAALENVIEENFENVVVEQAFNAKKALSFLAENKIDILVLDIELGDDDGFDLLHKAKRFGFDGKVIVISSKDEKLCSDLAVSAGASGYLDKKESVSRVADAIKAVNSGYTYFRQINTATSHGNGTIKLSTRESAVLRLLLDGHTNKEIARRMNISEKTVSTYKRRILDKYDVRSVFMLVKNSSYILK
ncbi:response regulator transcription factor [Vibrio mediterranei]|uniref:response regulator transcription factor n=1 Tax=Vibrio TaxID=662 RepID=UPI00015415E0|nr:MULTISPECIES: response regulator transcription factor [Vibrio]EDL54171.1 putative fimbrial protein Z, transcriptional regulator (LuxR/UhpA family) [Vibrio mediterranei AK1]MCF4176162.1 response regulator transcription factor [Vibrio sp. McD22-P3]NUW75510.1 response regulator transcription factor [Vibrio mediterranei]USE03945.1 response regulator transcription factor [Vibrio sp. SCSIO 43133]